MNSSILTAIESLCDDIATNTNPEENKKRAEAVGDFNLCEQCGKEQEICECETKGVTVISKADCENLIVKIGELLGGAK